MAGFENQIGQQAAQERPSATDCFLVAERGHSRCPSYRSTRTRAHIVRREHYAYFGTVKRVRGEPCCPLL